ncbi:MAG: tetratricopeptide repeat protein [Planctomycetota bacterium]|nr:MAG: tetratricopeptide repeat protein [Planctomycetota bacterium]
MDGHQSPQERAEALFHAYLDQVLAGATPDQAKLMSGAPPELREELEALLDHYHFLRSALGGGEPVAAPGRVLGDYRLLAELGRGGMGVVWEAEQISLGRRVALKLLAPQLAPTPEHLERFRREAEACAHVSHPAVVALYSTGQAGGIPFLVQELVPGARTLAQRLDELRATTRVPDRFYREQAELIAQVAEGLQAAHQAGVIHRDVKPSNILIGRDGRPKITDFGLARLRGQLSVTRSGQAVGTPFYMSPEQVRGGSPMDHRTDVFSLGATLYEAMTLARPFDGDTTEQVADQILHDDPPDPRALRSQLPRDLAVICLKAVEKEPVRRYSTMAEFAADLRRFLDDEPVRAKPPGALQRLARWTRRHPGLATGGSIAAAAFVAVTVLLLRVRAARADALDQLHAADATSELLIELFRQAEPARTQGRTITAQDLAHYGAQRVRSELADQPLARARLLGALGRVHRELGEYEPAEALLLECLREYEAIGAVRHLDFLVRQADLAAVLRYRGDPVQAEMVARRAYEASHALAGESAPVTVAAALELGGALVEQGRPDTAEPLLEQTYARLQAVLGPENERTVKALSILSAARDLLGRDSVTEQDFLDVVARFTRLSGVTHPDTVIARLNLAYFYLRRGRFEEAEPLYRDVLDQMRSVLPSGHSHTLRALGGLCDISQMQGRWSEAEAWQREILAIEERTYGPAHESVLVSRNNLGNALTEMNRLEEAAAEFLAVQGLAEDRFGPDHRQRLEALIGLAAVRQMQAQTASALEAVQEVVRCERQDPDWQNGLAWHWSSPDSRARFPEAAAFALELAQRAVAGATAEQRPGFRDTLAWALLACGRAEEALAESRKALAEGPADRQTEFQDALRRLEAAVAARPDAGAH